MGVAAMILSFIIVPTVSSFTKKPEGVDEMFECYNKKVVVTSDTALTDDKNAEFKEPAVNEVKAGEPEMDEMTEEGA